VADARATVECTGEIRYLAELHHLEGALHATGNDRSAAERCFRDAMTTAREQGERLWELRAATTWARMVLQTGTGGAARGGIRDDLERLLASFDGGAGIPDLCDAQLVVAALRGGRVP